MTEKKKKSRAGKAGGEELLLAKAEVILNSFQTRADVILSAI